METTQRSVQFTHEQIDLLTQVVDYELEIAEADDNEDRAETLRAIRSELSA